MLEVEVRSVEIDGLTDWYWAKPDTGAWEGPMNDWKTHRENILSLVERRKTVLQAGGCMGMYPRLLSRMFSRVITFEPDPENYRILCMNCDSMGIETYNAALGSKLSTVALSGQSPTMANRGIISINRESNQRASTTMLTVDSLMLGALDFMMLDVEGYEDEVLAGARETIKRFSPVISMEMPGSRAREIVESLGYEEVASSVSDRFFRRKL